MQIKEVTKRQFFDAIGDKDALVTVEKGDSFFRERYTRKLLGIIERRGIYLLPFEDSTILPQPTSVA